MDYTLLLAELVTAVQKITSAGGSMTGAEILAAMLDVDGAGSGLDADLLDGKQASDFVRLSTPAGAQTISDAIVLQQLDALGYVTLGTVQVNDEIISPAVYADGILRLNGVDVATVNQIPGAETAASILTKLKTVDGAGSGLDADLLDGNQASAFLTAHKTPAQLLTDIKQVDGQGSGLDADLLDGKQASAFLQTGQPIDATTLEGHASGDFEPAGATSPANVMAAIKQVDGPGSGLDADLLDGKQASEFALTELTMFNGRVPVPAFLHATKNNGDYTIDFSGIVPDSATAVIALIEFRDAAQGGDVPKYCGFGALKSYTTDGSAQDNYMLLAKQYVAGRWASIQGIITLDGQNRAIVGYSSIDNGSGQVSVFVLGYYN